MRVLNFNLILKTLILLKRILTVNSIGSAAIPPNLKHNGHYTSNVRIITADASHPVTIRLNKQRILCNACLKRYMAKSNLVNKYCHISNASKHKILAALTKKITLWPVFFLNILFRFKKS